MDALPISGHVDDQHQLFATVPKSMPPGEVTIYVVVADSQDELEQSWMSGIARQWESELSDVRQDIYSLEDGEPVDAAR
jgi:hypothetical protein